MSIIGSGIKGVLDYGIDLKLESKEEENYYIIQMCEFFNEESEFKAYLSGDTSFEIEHDRTSPVMEVCIQDSLLTIIPYTDDIFEAFTLILSFIAKHHQSIVTEMRGTPQHNKIEDPEDIKEKEGTNVSEEISDPDEDSSDDYEWI